MQLYVLPMPTMESSDTSTRQSMLSRGLSVLNCFTSRDASLTLSEISRQTGLSKATAHRLVGELLEWGLLDRDGRRLYLGPQVAALFDRLPEPCLRIHRLLPHARRIRYAADRPALLTVLTRDRSVHVDALFGRRIQETDLTLGGPLTACVSAASKVIAAFRGPPHHPSASYPAAGPCWPDRDLASAKDRGYSTSRTGESLAAAVPICDRDGYALGALSVSVPVDAPARVTIIEQLLSTRRALDGTPRRQEPT
jgi:DNA-binding IclR family transcriptional regulator